MDKKKDNNMFKTVTEAEQEFELAWQNPKYTQIELNDVDINKVLSENYILSSSLRFTRAMLWDMETKKAWNPKQYIPYVVRSGKSWRKHKLESGDELFVRSSQQSQWLNNSAYEDVFEEVYINNISQKVTFLGTKILENESGELIDIQNYQPLFHVEHSTKGTEEQPLNGWRIVHLTKEKDYELIKLFNNFNNSTVLPRFIEIYIENDLKINLSRK